MTAIPELTSDAGTLGAALAYAAAGIYVLPVARRHPTDPGKHPGSVVGKKWQDKSSRDPAQIAAWFAGTDHGIALHCGRSGLVVFDVDNYEKVPEVVKKYLDTAPYQSTRPDQPGRGHYIFQQPAGRTIGNSVGKLGGAWGEVRGLNGVIIAAPSWHPAENGQYRWERVGTIPGLPDEIAELLDDAGPAEDAATDAQVAAFIAEHTAGSRPEVINGLKATLIDKIAAGESRHDSTVSVVVGALKEARAGFYSAQHVADTLKPIFVNAAQLGDKNRRTPARAEAEWDDIVAWGVGQALAADLNEVRARVQDKMPDDSATTIEAPAPAPATPVTLAEAHTTFRKWLGADYDTDALDATLVTVAVERLDGDPLWLLIISGSGNAKTETAQSCNGVGAVITSAIASEAALLSATPKRERAKDATGGLLRRIGANGVLVIKDVTSILSMDRNIRARVLAALREVYDGRWVREVGSEGGRSIEWKGRIAVVGAVTTAWDAAHSVISAMGDRFVLIRVDSTKGRQAAGRQAIGNTGSEAEMRAELSAAAAGVIAGMNTDPIAVTEEETNVLLAAADLVTRARTAVEFDYRGDVIDAHAPEMPTRFAKQLTQIVRGAVAIGMGRRQALRLAIRCARDSMPPLRLAIIDDVAEHPESTPTAVRKRLGKPRATVDRQLQALHMLGVVEVEEIEDTLTHKTRWYYSLDTDVDPDSISPQKVSPDLLVDTSLSKEERGKGEDGDEGPSQVGTHISGDTPVGPPPPQPAPSINCVHCLRPVTARTQVDAAGKPAHLSCIPKDGL